MTLGELEALDRPGLVAAWASLCDTPVPRGLSRPLLLRFLAAELQARHSGGLPKRLRAALLDQAGRAATPPKAPGLKPGGRLLREWNGITHAVEITDTGCRWNGQRYPSLSAVARAITGAHWSGPRFFGLTGGGAASGARKRKVEARTGATTSSPRGRS